MKKLLVCAVVLASLSACNRMPWSHGQETKEKAQQQAETKAKSAKKTTVNQPVENAMEAIPPQLRVDFQKALECQIKHRAPGQPGIVIDEKFVRDLTSKLKADPSIAKC